jgi:hypothetical protein
MPTKSPETYFQQPELTAARAIYRGDAVALREALRTPGLRLAYTSPQGMTLLIFALANRQAECTQVLLQAGADPNQRTLMDGRSPVQPVALAAGWEDSRLLTMLLDAGGSPNSIMHDGVGGNEPAVFSAIHGRQFANMRLLLDRGADLNGVNDLGYTPVLMLATFNQFEQVAYLIERGADFNKPAHSGNTVAFLVQDREFKDHSSEAYQWQQRVRALLEARGVKFPVANPGAANGQKSAGVARYRQQWLQLPEGRSWKARIDAAPNSTEGFRLRLEAQDAFRDWLKQQLPADNELLQYELSPSRANGIEGF